MSMVVMLKDIVECSVGFGGDVTTCTACTGDQYKSDIANTECLDKPEESTIPNEMVINGGNTDFCKFYCHLLSNFYISTLSSS